MQPAGTMTSASLSRSSFSIVKPNICYGLRASHFECYIKRTHLHQQTQHKLMPKYWREEKKNMALYRID